jgi:SAM-dependent methyltransferase
MHSDDARDPAAFYTGLVAELYAPLRGSTPDPAVYERFVRATGEPALELGCGDGDPLMALCERGLHVEGLDSSADMLERARARAAQLGIDVALHLGDMRSFATGRTYRSIYLAGATFNLLPTDADAVAALRCIRGHLEPDGEALVPLFVPPTNPSTVGTASEAVLDGGDRISCTTTRIERDEAARTQTSRLRYVRDGAHGRTEVERDWLLHWFSPSQFGALAEEAGLSVQRCSEWDGRPATDASTGFAVTLAAARSGSSSC